MLFSLRFSKSDVLVIRLDDKTQRQLRRVLSSSHSAHPVDVAVSPIWRQNQAAYGSRTVGKCDRFRIWTFMNDGHGVDDAKKAIYQSWNSQA